MKAGRKQGTPPRADIGPASFITGMTSGDFRRTQDFVQVLCQK